MKTFLAQIDGDSYITVTFNKQVCNYQIEKNLHFEICVAPSLHHRVITFMGELYLSVQEMFS